MAYDGLETRRSIADLIRDLADSGVALVRSEVRLAKIEVTATVTAIGMGTALVALGVVLALVGVLALIVGAVLLIGDQWLPADLYWVAALALLLITGGLAAWFARRGMAMLSPSNMAPHETLATLKEDREWLKQQLTSGATSS